MRVINKKSLKESDDMGAKPVRIDDSLYRIIENQRKRLSKDTGLDVSFSQASRLIATEHIQFKMGKKLCKKEKSIFNL